MEIQEGNPNEPITLSLENKQLRIQIEERDAKIKEQHGIIADLRMKFWKLQGQLDGMQSAFETLADKLT